MRDHRSCIRWRINWQAQVKLPQKEAPARCLIDDINFKGMRITLEEKLPKDAPFTLSVTLSAGLTLNIEGWIAWSKSIDKFNHYGIYFTRINDSDKEEIYQFLQRNFPKQVYNRWWGGIIEEKGGGGMEDRRLFERFSVQFPLRVLDLNSGREGKGHVCDVSAKGLSFLADEDLTSSTRLEMWLLVPDKGEPFYTRGEVTWSEKVEPDKYRIGVDLERADLMGLSRILRVI